MPTPITEKFKNKTHGKHSTYSKGCRCEDCTVAHRLYYRERQRIHRRAEQGIGPKPEPQFIDATQAREHLLHLARHGIGHKSVMEKTGIYKSNLQKIRQGKQKTISRDTERRILSVFISSIDAFEFVDATYTRKLQQELLDAGFTHKKINETAGAEYKASNSYVGGNWIQYWRQENMEKAFALLMPRPPKAKKPAVPKRLHSKK